MTTGFLKAIIRIKKKSADRRLARFMFLQEVVAFLAWGDYFFVFLRTKGTMMANIIITMESISKSLISLPSFPQLPLMGFLCNRRVQTLRRRPAAYPYMADSRTELPCNHILPNNTTGSKQLFPIRFCSAKKSFRRAKRARAFARALFLKLIEPYRNLWDFYFGNLSPAWAL